MYGSVHGNVRLSSGSAAVCGSVRQCVYLASLRREPTAQVGQIGLSSLSLVIQKPTANKLAKQAKYYYHTSALFPACVPVGSPFEEQNISGEVHGNKEGRTGDLVCFCSNNK
jgi:hypothetical protein